MRVHSKGVTLLELMVSVGIFGLLLVALFFIFRTGANAWTKGHTESAMLSTLQVVSARLSRAAERSTRYSLNVDSVAKGVSFLSAVDANGRFQYNPVSRLPLWQEYLIYFYDSTRQTINMRAIPVVGTPQERAATTFERAFGTPLSDEFVGGVAIARKIVDARFEQTADDQLVLEFDVERTRYHLQGSKLITSRTVVKLRN